MPEYVFRAINSKGLIVKNRVEDSSKQTLIKKLKGNGLMPIDIVQVRFASKKKQKKVKRNVNDMDQIMQTANSSSLFQTAAKSKMSLREKLTLAFVKQEKITPRDIVIFTQNFYLLKKANFNNIHALSTIIDSTENISFKGVLEDILAGLESGEYLYTTMEYYSNIFPYIYINMIKVGELSGSLEKSLGQAIKYLDDSSVLTKKLKKIFIPNIIQFALILAALVVGTLVAVPAIQKVYDSVGSSESMPKATIWFSNLLENIMKYWYIPTIIIGVIVGLVIYYINTPKGKYNFHLFKYTMPMFGKLIFSLDFSRLMKAMLLNLENGMRIQDALEISKNICKNYVMLSLVETSINNIIIGQSWIEPFEKSGLASSMILEMMKIGMQTDLTSMMEKLLDYMDIDINNTMDKIMATLPQVVYMIVGVVLIFLVLVVLVPCIQAYSGGFLFDSIE